MTEDVGEADADSTEQSPFAGLVMVIKDVKVYLMMLTFTAYVVGLSFNAFFPTLTQTLGFGYIPTLLMSSPPWAFSCIVSIINAWHADRTQEKFWHIVGPIVGGLVGFAISMSTLNVAAQVRRTFPPSKCLCRIHRLLLLDQLIVPTTTCQASRRHRDGQRILATWKYRWLLCLEPAGKWILQELWYCDFHVWSDHTGLLRFQVDSRQT